MIIGCINNKESNELELNNHDYDRLAKDDVE